MQMFIGYVLRTGTCIILINKISFTYLFPFDFNEEFFLNLHKNVLSKSNKHTAFGLNICRHHHPLLPSLQYQNPDSYIGALLIWFLTTLLQRCFPSSESPRFSIGSLEVYGLYPKPPKS